MRRVLRSVIMILFHAGFVRPVLAILGVRYRRKSLVPRGPCLVVANHNSHLDAAVLMSLFPLRRLPHVHPVAAADYFGKSWLLRTMAMLMMNGIPIERKPALGSDPLAGLTAAFNEGKSLIFFPEGSRGQAGVVAPFRQGVGRLVRSVPGLPVVPVFMSGPERIWPRGKVVPVPLSIDAAVGKPRTYSHDLPAARIAELVRRDVLALAPPPPPVPGPRPSPPVRVAVCGIDSDTREAAFLAITERLGGLDRTLGIAEPFQEADGEGMREVIGGIPMARGRAWVSMLAWALRTGGMYKGSKFAEMVQRARVDEALDHGRVARFVVGDGNPLVDLLAWAEVEVFRGVIDERELQQLVRYLTGRRRIPARQWWRFIRKEPEVWLLNILDLVRIPVPDILVRVTVSPTTAMARIRSRGEERRPHENEAFLEELQTAYGQVAKVLQRRWRVEALEFHAGESSPEQIARQVQDVCRRFVARPEPVTPAKGS